MIKSLTSLRGIFILFIFFHHCMNIYPGGGTMAVAFFFVLGGFVMTLGYKDKVIKADFDYKMYLTRRCIKFYPLHWLCILAVMPLALLSFSWLDIPKLVLNASLLHTWVPIYEYYFSFNWVSWYLANTMFFAVVFPFVFKWIGEATPKKAMIIILITVIIYTFVALLIPEDKYHAILYISPYMRLTDFVFGIILALGYMKLKDWPHLKHLKWNGTVYQIVIFMLIIFLVVESCLLSENVTLLAPVYWIPIALLIVMTSLSERAWGGTFVLGKQIYNKTR